MLMSDLYYLVSSQFEAASQITSLAQTHRASRLHGHSYSVSLRIKSQQQQNEILSQFSSELEYLSEKLNYGFLNDVIENPTDENISKWFLSQHGLNQQQEENIYQVAVQSTQHSGVDLVRPDQKGLYQAHIWRRYRFEAAHQLPNVEPGHQCGRMHGHGFEVILHVNQQLLDQEMGVDFDLLDQLWFPIYKQLNNRCLNDIKGLENPTSEVLSHWIWQQIKPQVDALSWVTVYETHSSGCHYNGRDYRIWKEFLFESAIKKSGQLLGHSYKCRLHLQADLDEVMGWTVDYGDVKKIFKPVYEQLDHHCLNDSLNTYLNEDELNLPQLLMWMKQQISEKLPQLDRIDCYQQPGQGAQLCWGSEPPAIPD
ncbi:MAG: 6-carboxytetrahydropterin synthase [Gammaproteobacteria bacterium]|nr:6-carboxytetrahydropterin synthase [Gammaproteobacteria bacterium]